MGVTIERFVDAAYKQATGRKITGLLGSMSELTPPRMVGLAAGSAGVLGKGVLRLAERGSTSLWNTMGLGIDVLDLSKPDELLEYREQTITINRDIIMEDERGIIRGVSLFGPWSEAAWAKDTLVDNAAYLKPPIALADDFYRTLGERGITDGSVRAVITYRVIQSLPQPEDNGVPEL